MLVLNRKLGQSIVIGDEIIIKSIRSAIGDKADELGGAA